MKKQRAELAAAEKRLRSVSKRFEQERAHKRATLRNQLMAWLTLVGDDGINAAMKKAATRLHPDVATGDHDNFVMLTKLTEWMKQELRKKQLGFRGF